MDRKRIRIKMCGMTQADDIAHAVYLGVDAIGLIFYEGSSRYISFEKARELLSNLPPFVNPVAVLVNPEPNFVKKIIKELPIHWLQFHGDETPEFCKQFNKPFIKALHPQDSQQIKRYIGRFKDSSAILFDTPSTLSRGGTGQTFDWNIIPDNLQTNYILSGGLNAENVKIAVNSCHPYAVDVSSGIEKSPGIKDHKKMSEFIKALRSEE